MLHGQPTLKYLAFALPPCNMDNLHLNIYPPYYRHATLSVYTAIFTLRINSMLHDKLNSYNIKTRVK